MVPPETGGSPEPLWHQEANGKLVPASERHLRNVTDRVVFFDKGRVAEEGPPSQIFTNPENPRTKAFLKAVLQQ